jgi:hypothetical protein
VASTAAISRSVDPGTVSAVETLAAITLSLYRSGPQATIHLPTVPLDMNVASVYLCDLPPAPQPTAVLELSLTGLLDDSSTVSILATGDRDRFIALAAEILRVVTIGALAARGLRPAELTSWETLAGSLTP